MKTIKYIAKAITLPITNDFVFFIQIIFLLIIPTLINAFFINSDSYLTFSSQYAFGFIIRHGASIPYILFLPWVLLYIMSCIGLTIYKYSKSCYYIYKTIIYICAFILYSLNIFLLLNFDTMLAPTIIMLISETNIDEASDFINLYMLGPKSILSYIIILLTVTLFIFNEIKIKVRFNTIGITCIFLISCYFIQRGIKPISLFLNLFSCTTLSEVETWFLRYHPDTNSFTNVTYSFYTVYISKEELNKAISSTLNAKIKSQIINTNIFLIIGESFNKHHSQLYGYELHTSPHLSKEKEEGNLYTFSNVITPYNLTSYVMRNLFSTNSIMEKENWADFPAFTYIMKKAGYNVFFWDNQKSTRNSDVSDYSINSYLYNKAIIASSYTRCNKSTYKYDHELINSFFNEVNLSDNGNLAIFHLRGQHYKAENRYPHKKEFLHFSKDSIISSNLSPQQKEIIAHYDNATLYNDKIIYQIIERCRATNTILIYFPDHGEEVYDYRDLYGRTLGNNVNSEILKYQYEIPFMIWCSNLYKSTNPQIIKDIIDATPKPFMIDNFCQILFYLAGINCDYSHPERCLISPNYKAYPYRTIPPRTIYEKIRK